jgi:hypothetical protein
MGAFGSFVVCRSETPMDELVAIAERDEGLENHQVRQGGWQIGTYYGTYIVQDADAMIKELAVETGAPTMTGYFFHSNTIGIDAYSEAHGKWSACLGRAEMANLLGMDGMLLENTFPDAAGATMKAVRWAVEAGLVPSEPEVLAVFEKPHGDPMIEPLMFELLEALGMSDGSEQAAADQ